jgi:hypothetical protein
MQANGSDRPLTGRRPQPHSRINLWGAKGKSYVGSAERFALVGLLQGRGYILEKGWIERGP